MTSGLPTVEPCHAGMLEQQVARRGLRGSGFRRHWGSPLPERRRRDWPLTVSNTGEAWNRTEQVPVPAPQADRVGRLR